MKKLVNEINTSMDNYNIDDKEKRKAILIYSIILYNVTNYVLGWVLGKSLMHMFGPGITKLVKNTLNLNISSKIFAITIGLTNVVYPYIIGAKDN